MNTMQIKVDYEEFFKGSTAKHWPEQPADFYLRFVAQAVIESGLDPRKISKVGASGLMQIMPKTYRDIRLYLPRLSEKICDPASNIEGGIWYMRWIFDRLVEIEDFEDRFRLALASYNMGLSRVKPLLLKGRTYAGIKGRLPEQIVDYIATITQIYEEETDA